MTGGIALPAGSKTWRARLGCANNAPWKTPDQHHDYYLHGHLDTTRCPPRYNEDDKTARVFLPFATLFFCVLIKIPHPLLSFLSFPFARSERL
jgi:hypothetical protein